MAFCKFSTGFIAESSIVLDSMFLNDYVPYAPESCLKVYLFGLAKCYNSTSYDNTIENFEKVLNLSKEDIISSFLSSDNVCGDPCVPCGFRARRSTPCRVP